MSKPVYLFLILLSFAVILLSSCEKDDYSSKIVAKLSTSAISNIKVTSALVAGEVKRQGGSEITQCGVIWSKTKEFTIDANHGRAIGGFVSEQFFCVMTYLDPETTYYVKSYAISSDDVAYGDVLSFKTLGYSKPSTRTDVSTYVNYLSALSGLTIISDGFATITSSGIVWSTTADPTINDNVITFILSAGSAKLYITGLMPNTTYYVKSFATNSEGTAYGEQTTFTTKAYFGTVTDFDGNVYNTTKIGNQEWMAENLKVTSYSNGMSIPLKLVNSEWSNLWLTSTDAYCYLNNDSNSKYGALYTWSAAMGRDVAAASNANPSGVQGICPNGWHLPSESEWNQLQNYLIGDGYNYDGSTYGNKIAKSLSSTSLWYSYSVMGSVGNDVKTNNKTGFTALPGGYRSDWNGSFYSSRQLGFWLTATENTYPGYFHAFEIKNSRVYLRKQLYESKIKGGSVRCVKD